MSEATAESQEYQVLAVAPEEGVSLIAELPVFEGVARDELAWVVARGEFRRYPAGTAIRNTEVPIVEMSIPLEGRVSLYLPRGGGWRKLMEAGRGYVFGVVPYSRMRTAPGTLVVEEDSIAFTLHRDHFPELVKDCPEVTAALVHQMLDRAREFRTVQLNDDRMQSLGRLASGLAHELNNPASAAARSARSLEQLLGGLQSSSRELASAHLSETQLQALDTVLDLCGREAPPRSTLEAADREDDFGDWLDRHDADSALAGPLAASEVTIDALDQLADAMTGDALAVALRWLGCDVEGRSLARQIVAATGRIHDLVGSVKGFTFMDREGVPEEVDIARGLANTIAMLENKSRAKSVHVRIETADNLPRVYGYGSDINQIWEKLVDNAIDAAGRDGQVTVTATTRGEDVVVRVADSGPGIPEENQGRIFDPFFTTKPVGAGTGLGLDLARRFVQVHNGEIDFTTQPGRTVFRVRLPISGARSMRAAPGSLMKSE